MPGPHDKIIASAAKAALAPLGFRRKGRSRTWFADLGWWLLVVEFQPSSWSKGSYLNVAAHWLWVSKGHMSFDFGGRSPEYIEYQSDEQFAPEADRLAESAASEAERLRCMITSLDATAELLLQEARALDAQNPGHPGWMEFHAAIALGLAGRQLEASQMIEDLLHAEPSGSLLHTSAERMAALIAKPSELEREVLAIIARQRDALGLPPWEGQLR